MEPSIELIRLDDSSAYLKQVDRAETGDELYDEFEDNSEEVFAIRDGDTVVGLLYLDDDTEAFLFVYIFPAYRNRGYGRLALAAAERQLKSEPLSCIETLFISGNETAKRFAAANGYTRTFASACMQYDGKPFAEPGQNIRPYRDEDYPEAFALSAEAFHLMRVGTGCFPHSTVAQPSEESRKRWADAANDEYVYVLNDEIIGYARLDDAELDSVSIKPPLQGKGYGRTFVRYLTDRILEKDEGEPVLWCVVGNNKARALYDSLGYRELYREDFAEKRFGK